MSFFDEYALKQLSGPDLIKEQARLLKKLSELRGHSDVLVYAASLSAPPQVGSIVENDLMMLQEALGKPKSKHLDVEIPKGRAIGNQDHSRRAVPRAGADPKRRH